ncbi:MAG: peptidoglycan DD-metalloendopeptidase family protein [Bacteroidota bacterium]
MRKLLFVVYLFCFTGALAQQPVQFSMSKAELEAKRKEIQNAINETEKQLEAIKSNKQATMGQLRALQNKLADRQRLIGNINDELGTIDNDIRKSSREVMTLKQKLELLKTRYVQSIRYAYETRSSYGMLAFLFSSSNFNDAMRRMKYLKKFREYRVQQVEQIYATSTQLQRKIGTLNQEKAEQAQLLSTQVQQKQVLIKETDETNKVVQDLKGKESQLLRDIEKQRQVTARINNAIRVMIEQEMAKAQKAAEEAEKKKAAAAATTAAANPGTVKPGPATAINVPKPKPKPRGDAPTLMLTPTDMELASNFEGNRGKMYWPVEKGYISGHFGVHPHPLAPQVNVDNIGIDIQTDAGATVKAVFNGTVISVFTAVGSNWIVTVKHGNYCTVYNGLASVAVKKGQEVTARQVLGTVATNDEDLPVVSFQIWKWTGSGNVKLNPEQWIAKPR